VLYLLRTGCQWRFLPADFPKWTTVYAWWRKWSQPDADGVSVLKRALKNQVGAARLKQGRNATPTLLIVDALGLPHAVAVTTAEVTDRKGALQALRHSVGSARDSGRAGDGADCQTQRTARLRGHAPALDRRAQLCVAGEEPAAVEELRAMAQHQLAVRPPRVSRFAPQEIVNRP
jgi:transposase